MSTGDRNTFFQLGGLDKGNQSKATNCVVLSQLRTFLRNLPSLSLSDKGEENVCQRFNVSAEELADTLAALQRPNAPTEELLSVIGAAVGARLTKGKGGALC